MSNSNAAKDLHTKIYTRFNLTADQIEYMAGLGAALFSVVLTYPINKLMYRQSLWGYDIFNAFRQLKAEGFGYLYRGVFPPVIIKSISSSIMFGTYNQYYKMLIKDQILGPTMGNNQMLTTFLASIMSGSTEAILTPMERVQMILQDSRWNTKYKNTFDALVKLRHYGLKEYYRGATAILLRNGPSTFLYFGFKDKVKEYILPMEPNVSQQWIKILLKREVIRDFITGASLGAVISTIFYPVNVVRIHMQSKPVGSEHIGIIRTFARLYYAREGANRLLLSGIGTNVVRSFMYWGCITAFSEIVRAYLQQNQN